MQIDALDDWCIMPALQDLSQAVTGVGKKCVGADLLRRRALIASGDGERKRPHDVQDENTFVNDRSA